MNASTNKCVSGRCVENSRTDAEQLSAICECQSQSFLRVSERASERAKFSEGISGGVRRVWEEVLERANKCEGFRFGRKSNLNLQFIDLITVSE